MIEIKTELLFRTMLEYNFSMHDWCLIFGLTREEIEKIIITKKCENMNQVYKLAHFLSVRPEELLK